MALHIQNKKSKIKYPTDSWVQMRIVDDIKLIISPLQNLLEYLAKITNKKPLLVFSLSIYFSSFFRIFSLSIKNQFKQFWCVNI